MFKFEKYKLVTIKILYSDTESDASTVHLHGAPYWCGVCIKV